MDDGDGTYRVAIALDEVAPGRSRRCVIDGHAVLVCNVGGDVYAIADTCTHDHGPLGEGRLRGHFIECPRHGSRFDLHTGRPLTLPAYVPVETFPVIVEDDTIKVEVE